MRYANRTPEYQENVERCLARRHPFVLYKDNQDYVTIYPAEANISLSEGCTVPPPVFTDVPDIAADWFSASLQVYIDAYPNFHALVPVRDSSGETVTVAIPKDIF